MRVTILIEGEPLPEVIVGAVADIEKFKEKLGHLGAWFTLDQATAPVPSVAEAGTPSVWRQVYKAAEPATDAQFAALVAVYLHLHRNKSTRTLSLIKLAKRVNRPLKNPSMAISQAMKKEYLVKKRSGTPALYVPTSAAIADWGKYVERASRM